MADKELKRGEGERGQFTDTTYAHDPVYRAQLEASEKAGECLFCKPEIVHEDFIDSIEIDGHKWIAKHNKYPYSSGRSGEGPTAKVHAILVPERHIEVPAQMHPEDVIAMWALYTRLGQKLCPNGGALATRYGTESGVTIFHIHAHVIAAPHDEEGKLIPVWFPVG